MQQTLSLISDVQVFQEHSSQFVDKLKEATTEEEKQVLVAEFEETLAELTA